MKTIKLSCLLLLIPIFLISFDDLTDCDRFLTKRNFVTANIDTNVVIKITSRLSTDSINWVLNYIWTMDYNNFAYLTLRHGFNSDDTLYYDQLNRLVEKHYRHNSWEFHIEKNEYFDNDKIKKKLHITFYNDSINAMESSMYEYYNDDKIKKEIFITYDKDSTKFKTYNMNLYLYNNNRLSFVYYYYSDSANAEPALRSMYSYSQMAYEQLDIVGQKNVNGVWITMGTQTFEYSMTGKEIHSYNKPLTHESWREYDPVSDSIVHIKQFFQPNITTEDFYSYNTEGQLTSTINIRPDGTSETNLYYYKNKRLDSVYKWYYPDFEEGFHSTKYVYKNDLLIQERHHAFSQLSGNEYEVIDYEYRQITDIRNDESSRSSLIISPNPASNFIEITDINPMLKHGVESTDIRIYNVFGQILTTPNPTPALPASGEGVRIDVSGLAPGMYFVRVVERVQKFIKL